MGMNCTAKARHGVEIRETHALHPFMTISTGALAMLEGMQTRWITSPRLYVHDRRGGTQARISRVLLLVIPPHRHGSFGLPRDHRRTKS
eukprot:5119897-Pyramimonas_sp.AAC.1